MPEKKSFIEFSERYGRIAQGTPSGIWAQRKSSVDINRAVRNALASLHNQYEKVINFMDMV